MSFSLICLNRRSPDGSGANLNVYCQFCASPVKTIGEIGCRAGAIRSGIHQGKRRASIPLSDKASRSNAGLLMWPTGQICPAIMDALHGATFPGHARVAQKTKTRPHERYGQALKKVRAQGGVG
jgi:hypothetical protein